MTMPPSDGFLASMADKEIGRPTAPESLLDEFHPHIMLIPASDVLDWIQ